MKDESFQRNAKATQTKNESFYYDTQKFFERIGKNLTANARSLFPIQQGFMDAGLFKMFESGIGSRKFDKK